MTNYFGQFSGNHAQSRPKLKAPTKHQCRRWSSLPSPRCRYWSRKNWIFGSIAIILLRQYLVHPVLLIHTVIKYCVRSVLPVSKYPPNTVNGIDFSEVNTGRTQHHQFRIPVYGRTTTIYYEKTLSTSIHGQYPAPPVSIPKALVIRVFSSTNYWHGY